METQTCSWVPHDLLLVCSVVKVRTFVQALSPAHCQSLRNVWPGSCCAVYYCHQLPRNYNINTLCMSCLIFHCSFFLTLWAAGNTDFSMIAHIQLTLKFVSKDHFCPWEETYCRSSIMRRIRDTSVTFASKGTGFKWISVLCLRAFLYKQKCLPAVGKASEEQISNTFAVSRQKNVMALPPDKHEVGHWTFVDWTQCAHLVLTPCTYIHLANLS